MSGGEFDYSQNGIEDTAERVEDVIVRQGNDWSELTLFRAEETVYTLRKAAEMLRRLDWLVSGDDGEDTFNRKWEKNLLLLAETYAGIHVKEKNE